MEKEGRERKELGKRKRITGKKIGKRGKCREEEERGKEVTDGRGKQGKEERK